ncbi:MAG TPA: nucleoside triphosphate pyrophosphohydrolase [Gemmatimonadaceae bacterium]|jgi:MazG family protein|nr:nucleoside triphosphate pyrophosphohydrolase [Gemmatimonadaceae bacterium]
MDKTHSLDDTLALMRDLRKRCEWDAAQTHESLRPYLIEEATELDDAIRLEDDRLMREELGDVLLQVLFHSVLAEERGAFAFADVAEGLITKMKGRHPHLYGDAAKEPWERMKSRHRKSIGDGLPAALPALHRAHRLQDRAAGVGFDWPDVLGPAEKVEEELAEVRAELQQSKPAKPGSPPAMDARHYALEAEIGDLLFAVVNLARKAGVHSSLALDKANAKFERRFQEIEKLAKDRSIDIAHAGLEKLDALWDEIKQAEKNTSRE